jgi:DNA-binding response OmpR family regulator
MTELTALQDRVEELEMALGQSEGLRLQLAVRFGLTRKKAELLGMLLEREVVTHEGAHLVLYGRQPNGGPGLRCIQQHIHAIRARLSRDDVEITTLPTIGHRLTPENKQKLRHLLQQEAA